MIVEILGHKACECPGDMGQTTEEVNQVYGERKYDMNSSTYHAGLRNHPNFRYGNPSNQMNPNFQSGNQSGGGKYQGRQGGNQGGYQRNNYNQGGNQGYNNRDNNYQRGYNQGGSSSNQGNSSGSKGGDESLSSKMDALMNAAKESSGDIKEMRRVNEERDKSHEALAKQVGQLAEELA